jgi:hypothetical protein
MLQAILHGKLSREEEGMEDLLTSSVFGLMKYVPLNSVLLPFLGLAYDPLSSGSLREWLTEIVGVEDWRFWPYLTSQGCNPCEPDVDILLKRSDGSETWILIEAKYGSGKSSFARKADMPPMDQLAREFDNLRVMAEERNVSQYAVIYLTADYVCPKEAIEESSREYKSKRHSCPRLYWLSWRLLFDILEEQNLMKSPIIQDLREIILRLDLTMFRRLRFDEVRKCHWSFERALKSWKWVIDPANWRFERERPFWRWLLAPSAGYWNFSR